MAVQPTKEGPGALADVLDRLLDKGIVLNLDLVIGVADVPLIGISLRAAIAAVETMIDFGMLEWWKDEAREKKCRSR